MMSRGDRLGMVYSIGAIVVLAIAMGILYPLSFDPIHHCLAYAHHDLGLFAFGNIDRNPGICFFKQD